MVVLGPVEILFKAISLTAVGWIVSSLHLTRFNVGNIQGSLQCTFGPRLQQHFVLPLSFCLSTFSILAIPSVRLIPCQSAEWPLLSQCLAYILNFIIRFNPIRQPNLTLSCVSWLVMKYSDRLPPSPLSLLPVCLNFGKSYGKLAYLSISKS